MESSSNSVSGNLIQLQVQVEFFSTDNYGKTEMQSRDVAMLSLFMGSERVARFWFVSKNKLEVSDKLLEIMEKITVLLTSQ